MKNFKMLALLIFTTFAQFGCSKDDDKPQASDPIIPNEPAGYVQYGTPFSNMPETSDVVIYEVNLRAFSSTGDINGVTAKLDHLEQLGVNVIWLMPIHPIGQVNSVNSPYSVKDFKAVGSEFGTLADLRNLTTQAHERGMAVMMDWIANHTAWDNTWINTPSWYTQDSNGNIIHPAGTNWLDVADLNFNNQEMRAAMIDAMKYWVLEANVDGYRCDHADGVPHDFWQAAIADLRAIPNRHLMFLAEGTRPDHYNAGFDIMFGWDFYYRMKDVYNGQPANILYSTNVSEYANVPAGKHRMRYTTNHDESAWENTPMVFFNGKNGALAASVATIFMNGVPLLYTGQEVGRQNTVPIFSNTNINWNENPDMLLAYQQMMGFYKASDVARRGVITNYPDQNVVSFTKTIGTQQLQIISNMRNTTMEYNVPPALQNSTWSDAISASSTTLSTTISLAPYQYMILKTP